MLFAILFIMFLPIAIPTATTVYYAITDRRQGASTTTPRVRHVARPAVLRPAYAA